MAQPLHLISVSFAFMYFQFLILLLKWNVFLFRHFRCFAQTCPHFHFSRFLFTGLSCVFFQMIGCMFVHFGKFHVATFQGLRHLLCAGVLAHIFRYFFFCMSVNFDSLSSDFIDFRSCLDIYSYKSHFPFTVFRSPSLRFQNNVPSISHICGIFLCLHSLSLILTYQVSDLRGVVPSTFHAYLSIFPILFVCLSMFDSCPIVINFLNQARFMYAPVRGCAIYFALAYVRLHALACLVCLGQYFLIFNNFPFSFSRSLFF